MADFRARLSELLESGGAKIEPLTPGPVVVYGAGNAGRAIAEEAKKRGFDVRTFLDARAHEIGSVAGIPCHLPGSNEARDLASKRVPVIIGVFNYATDLRPIVAALSAAGFARIVTFYEIHEQFRWLPQFWLGERGSYREHREAIFAAFDLFEDETSRQIFHDHIALRLTFDLSFLSEPDQANQYTPRDLPIAGVPMRLIDGGAFTGDTIEVLLSRGMRIEALAAFEPDAENFARLRETVARRKNALGEVSLFQRGLAEQSGVRRFASGGGAASALAAAGETTLEVTSIDEALPDFAPNFIKLDIEGAEPAALRGAARTIARHQPVLSVCVYHAPDHLWALPLLVRERWPFYRLALRYHQFNGFDVVLYAWQE